MLIMLIRSSRTLIERLYLCMMQCLKVSIFVFVLKRYVKNQLYIGYMSNNMPEKVLEKISVKFDKVLITILFNVCVKLSNSYSIKVEKGVLDRLPIKVLQHEKLINSAIDILMKFGDLSNAERLFQEISKQSLVTYGTIMQGYSV